MLAADIVDRGGLRLVHARKVNDDINCHISGGAHLSWADAFLLSSEKTMPLMEFSSERCNYADDRQFLAAVRTNVALLSERAAQLGLDPYFELEYENSK